MEDIDALKLSVPMHTTPRYRLRDAKVYVSEGGLHFIDYLDPVGAISVQIDSTKLTSERQLYRDIVTVECEKVIDQVQTLAEYLSLPSSRVLDIGCGGGLFLSMLAKEGADVVGIELSDSRAEYARSEHGLEVHKRPESFLAGRPIRAIRCHLLVGCHRARQLSRKRCNQQREHSSRVAFYSSTRPAAIASTIASVRSVICSQAAASDIPQCYVLR